MSDIVPPQPRNPRGSIANNDHRRNGAPSPAAAIVVVILASCCLGSCLAYYWQLPARKDTPSPPPTAEAGRDQNNGAAPPNQYPLPAPALKPEYIIDTTQEFKPAPLSSRSPLSADALYQLTSPAVVKIMVMDAQKRVISQGSGFLANKRGMIVTNHHVIVKAQAAMVLFADKTALPMARVAAFDREMDIAVIVVNGPVRAQPLELSGSALPQVGSKVFAIGYPLGLTSTLSDGLVSGHQETTPRMTAILTNAAISRGSSGGPLLTTDGKVVGVTTASFTKGQNLNIAVPASVIAEILRRCE